MTLSSQACTPCSCGNCAAGAANSRWLAPADAPVAGFTGMRPLVPAGALSLADLLSEPDSALLLPRPRYSCQLLAAPAHMLSSDAGALLCELRPSGPLARADLHMCLPADRGRLALLLHAGSSVTNCLLLLTSPVGMLSWADSITNS
jgi:hypothetical protein